MGVWQNEQDKAPKEDKNSEPSRDSAYKREILKEEYIELF
jgi:hypothetical protein